MKIRIILLSTILFTGFPLAAQLELAGLWQGTLTTEHSRQTYPVEVYLIKTGPRVSGRIYIHISKSQRIETEIEGIAYKDFSIYLDEIKFMHTDGKAPGFLRKFELIWKRGINSSSLNGYWQENHKEIFHKQRHQGRIFLKKVLNKGV